MRLSEANPSQLTDEQIAHILYDGIQDDGKDVDVALLLGSRPQRCHDRAVAAAELYHANRTRYIMPSGGVEWEIRERKISEALYMRSILLERGVPDEAILPENEARTTKENMLYGAIQINRRLRFEQVRRVCIVTSAMHMRRSMALAHWLLPRTMELSAYPTKPPSTIAEAVSSPEIELARREIGLIQGLIQHGFMEDIEY